MDKTVCARLEHLHRSLSIPCRHFGANNLNPFAYSREHNAMESSVSLTAKIQFQQSIIQRGGMFSPFTAGAQSSFFPGTIYQVIEQIYWQTEHSECSKDGVRMRRRNV